MTWWEWFQAWANTNGGAVSILGVWITLAALLSGWIWTRGTTKLIAQGDAKTQEILARMDERWQQAWERMDQRADERHREVVQAIQALRG